MAYKDLLAQCIKNSGLSLREIAERCNELGQPISASYLSQLQNGKLPPASEEITKTIAQVCLMQDATELIFEGYMEKAPEAVRYYLTVTSEVNKQLLKIIDAKLLDLDINPQYYENLNCFSRLGMTISYLEKLKKSKDIKGFTDTGNLVREKFFEFFKYRDTDQVFIQDSSMEPLIPYNSKLNVHLINPLELKEKDVIAFKFDNKITARRFYRFDDIYSLVPENKEYEILYYKDVFNIDFLGKVISYTTSLS